MLTKERINKLIALGGAVLGAASVSTAFAFRIGARWTCSVCWRFSRASAFRVCFYQFCRDALWLVLLHYFFGAAGSIMPRVAIFAMRAAAVLTSVARWSPSFFVLFKLFSSCVVESLKSVTQRRKANLFRERALRSWNQLWFLWEPSGDNRTKQNTSFIEI